MPGDGVCRTVLFCQGVGGVQGKGVVHSCQWRGSYDSVGGVWELFQVVRCWTDELLIEVGRRGLVIMGSLGNTF